ncbi:holo-ACP synthase [Alicyclobacillus fastidiosus]|uniref:Holo-[acyl-carrier-protein] synthase n=1 Tax=Alicyclobacillus fastidiosus TaxID=392011 RepID=A0ABY6ZIC9_9BACL|nr:holo-ACP synthase [Alicyclobacillus fastidiosus]WAH41675.1 holo-ACP synthase [Alicyclobacillus fastidiosus]GMA63355.1 holo-[acyl-carrier-protein] synthase [Alicyclobacillus fastidiosus]
MILGVGTDIVETARILSALERYGDAFCRKVLGPDERCRALSYGGKRQAEFVAGRFAAKEALAKAVGCGIGRLAMSHVDVMVTESGLVVQFKSPSALADLPPSDTFHLSISHHTTLAFATAIWERP